MLNKSKVLAGKITGVVLAIFLPSVVLTIFCLMVYDTTAGLLDLPYVLKGWTLAFSHKISDAPVLCAIVTAMTGFAVWLWWRFPCVTHFLCLCFASAMTGLLHIAFY